MKGKVRSDMRWLSERASSGVFDPMQEVKKGVTVLETLKSKQSEPHKSHLFAGQFGSFGNRFWALVDGFITSWGSQFTLERRSCNSCHKDVQSNLTMVESASTGLWKIDKCPSVRPIGISECLRRIICKNVAEFTKIDIEGTCLTDQLVCGLRAGVEGGIHALTDVFDNNKEGGCGRLLIDASNAFNSLNHETALWNAQILWPRCSRFLFNLILTEALLRFSLLAPMK